MTVKACPRGQVKIDGRCKPHKTFGNIQNIENITTKHHTKGSDTYSVDIGNDVNIEVWQGPPDYKTKKRTMFFEDVHTKQNLSSHQINKLNKMARAMKRVGIANVKSNFVSASPKKIVIREKYKGDDVIYTYHGSMNYMPEKKGVKSGWTGFIELEIFKPTKAGKYGSETICLDLTKSVLKEIKECGYNRDTEEGYDKFMGDVSMNYNWAQKLVRLAREDFKKAR